VSDDPRRLLILGATGRTGRELVHQALARGHRITAIVRSPDKLGEPLDGLAVVAGDATRAADMRTAVAGHDAVISTIGPPGPGATTVTADGARAIVSVLEGTGVTRLLVVSVGVLFADAGLLAAMLRRTLLRGVADDAEEMERIVSASSLDWTIVRPPRLTNGASTACYAVCEGHSPHRSGLASLRRADLARFLLDETEHAHHVHRIVGIARTRRSSRAPAGRASAAEPT
jgi:putative NADH-flavin reductase